MKKSTKNISLILGITSLSVFLIHCINKLVFLFSSIKEVLYSENSNYYNWRFGKIFYTKKGNGTPLLLIHDLNCTSSDYEWKQVVNSFSENHTVYTLDLIGCGRSEKPKITYTNYLYVELISDFIKNVIKYPTDVIATGASSSSVIMACYADNQLFNKIIFINPQDLKTMSKYPKYKNKLIKYVTDCPIIGTLIYNLAVSKMMIKDSFRESYFYDPNKVKTRYVDAYYEAAHLSGSSSKYTFSSMKGHYTNINVVHAIKELNQSIYLIGGSKQPGIQESFEEYIYYNPSIETAFINNTKYLPQLETPKEFFKSCEIFLLS